jgi:hypothetical protein
MNPKNHTIPTPKKKIPPKIFPHNETEIAEIHNY